MNTALKLSALVILFLGEFFMIYAEMMTAKFPSWQAIPSVDLLKVGVCMTLAGFALLFGYFIAYKAYQDIWVVTVISVVSILIAEPLLAYLFFQELPERGASIGLFLGFLGLIATFTL